MDYKIGRLVYKIFFLAFIPSILLFCGFFLSIDAQSVGNNSTINSQNSSSGLIPTKKSYSLRISSPVTGDVVLINGTNYFNKNGEKFSVQGLSVFDTNSSLNCYVSIIANGVKPYQTTNGTGPKGSDDYTTWKYVFTPQYSHLKEGSNKITSKLSCQPGNLVAYYSVNVTGSIFNGTFPDQRIMSPTSQNLFSNNTVSSNSNNTNILSPFASSLSTSIQNNQSSSTSTAPINTTTISPSTTSLLNSNPSNKTSISSSPTTINQPNIVQPNPRSMNIAIEKVKNGKSQSILFTVKDTLTDKPIEDAFLSGNINGEPFSGMANSSGEFTKLLSSSVLKSSKTLEVIATATADGYKSNKVNTTFISSSTSKSSVANNDNNNNGAKDMTSRIAKDVQKQLSKQGINIPLPFGG